MKLLDCEHIGVCAKIRLNTITKIRLLKYTENFTTKKWKFSDKIYIFHISAQNIDCGYPLEPPLDLFTGISNSGHPVGDYIWNCDAVLSCVSLFVLSQFVYTNNKGPDHPVMPNQGLSCLQSLYILVLSMCKLMYIHFNCANASKFYNHNWK